MTYMNSSHSDPPCLAPTLAFGLGIAMAVSAIFAIAILLVIGTWRANANATDREQVSRGKYLVTLALCNDCHTPGYFFGKPDMTRFLGGSEVGFEIPNVGVFYPPNLTPDKETGLGQWSDDDIVRAIQTGVRPDGRILAPIMPWHAFAELTKSDAYAVSSFLKSLPPVKNKVVGPFGPTETPTSYVMKVVAPSASH
jgi:mono/diheme cytochrome c family protein